MPGPQLPAGSDWPGLSHVPSTMAAGSSRPNRAWCLPSWRLGCHLPGGLGSGAASQPRSASALQINDETELEALCAEIASQHLATESPDGPNKPCCRFTYLTMTGEEVELCSRGRHVPVA